MKQNFSNRSFPEVGEKKKEKKKERKKEKKEGEKIGENNGQLRFVRHHGWRTQARLDQNVKITAPLLC